MRQAAQAGDVEEIGRRLHNRLQPAAERVAPAIAVLYERLRSLGPAGQLMSGSGSTLFALCRDQREALRIAQGLRSAEEEIRSAGASDRGWVETIVRSCS
jgi:4-diphosphocytidyl-2-C-methyl-D-erythritol kinase